MLKTLLETQLSSDLITALTDLTHSTAEPLRLQVDGRKLVVLCEAESWGWHETADLLSSSLCHSIA